jgi:uncharacterized protein YecE (DUF72 family)
VIYVGTSGWVYPHWRKVFYPPGLAQVKELPFYAQRFPTVEINGTFYSLTRPNCVERWRQGVPPDFVFAIKGSRYITHMLKLSKFRTPLANFFAQGILRFGAQMGPILWQLPPRLKFTRERALPFLEALPRDIAAAERIARRHDERVTGRSALTAPDGRHAEIRHVIEVRDQSWLSDPALEILRSQCIALVAAETAGQHPYSLERTAEFAYVRLHGSQVLYGSQYTDDELDTWAARLSRWAAAGHDAYVYFDNDNKAYAPGDALRLTARVGACAAPASIPPAQEAARCVRQSRRTRARKPRTGAAV